MSDTFGGPVLGPGGELLPRLFASDTDPLRAKVRELCRQNSREAVDPRITPMDASGFVVRNTPAYVTIATLEHALWSTEIARFALTLSLKKNGKSDADVAAFFATLSDENVVRFGREVVLEPEPPLPPASPTADQPTT